jgi:cytochrome c553
MRSFVATLFVGIVMALPARAQSPNPPRVVEACVQCHGLDGIGKNRDIPNLAGQSRDELARKLASFRNGQRQHPTMNFFAVQASPAELEQVIDYFSSLPKP